MQNTGTYAGDPPAYSENLNEQGALGRASEPSTCVRGTIGWDGDDDHADMGALDNDGRTLVKVQLFAGRDTTEPLKGDVAQGHKILAQLNLLMGMRVPPKGSECLVIFPDGASTQPGAGVLIAALGKTATSDQFKKTRPVIDYGDQDFIVKAARIMLSTSDDETTGKPKGFIAITPEDGIQLLDDHGNGINIKDETISIFATDGADPPEAKMLVTIDKDTHQIFVKDGGYHIVDKDGVTAGGDTFSANTGGVALGAMASPATPVVVGPSGMAGIGSTSVRAQP